MSKPIGLLLPKDAVGNSHAQINGFTHQLTERPGRDHPQKGSGNKGRPCRKHSPLPVQVVYKQVTSGGFETQLLDTCTRFYTRRSGLTLHSLLTARSFDD